MSRHQRFYYPLVLGLAVATTVAFFSAPVQAADGSRLVASADNPLDPAGVTITNASASHTYKFKVPVPAGGHLRGLTETADPSAGVLIVNRTGTPVGAYDVAWAQDAAARPLPTRYRIQGNTLVQEIDFDATTRFPVVFDIVYNEITPAGAITVLRVDVPSNYVYNPSLSPTSWHDYCTSSPDEFPNPVGANADFRGPCARHDMCIQYRWASHQTCNNWLFNDLVENCQSWYAWYNPARAACIDTAGIYWAAVTAATLW